LLLYSNVSKSTIYFRETFLNTLILYIQDRKLLKKEQGTFLKRWNPYICAKIEEMELVFASNNRHKLEEISNLVGGTCTILNLHQAQCEGEIPETGQTLEENALQKAHYVYDKTGKNCFADDTGLEIDVLGGAPGVYTARFAGEHCTPKDNIIKTLTLLQGETNRNACFKTVIACIIEGKEYIFQGEVRGHIATEEMGEGGFGYDPIFIPEGFQESFAQMPLEQKNAMSHRGRATAKFVAFLQSLL